jgi:hypothetical protein
VVTFGGEGASGTSQADACGTLTANLSECDPLSFSNSSNETDRDDSAVFLQDSLRLGGGVTIQAGGRWDRTRFTYREDVPDPTNDQESTFSETSWKGGIAWNPTNAAGVYASYGESFLPPTVEDLFAFPTSDRTRTSSRAAPNTGSVQEAYRPSARSVDYSIAVFRLTSKRDRLDPTPAPAPVRQERECRRGPPGELEATGPPISPSGWPRRLTPGCARRFSTGERNTSLVPGSADGNDRPRDPPRRARPLDFVYSSRFQTTTRTAGPARRDVVNAGVPGGARHVPPAEESPRWDRSSWHPRDLRRGEELSTRSMRRAASTRSTSSIMSTARS